MIRWGSCKKVRAKEGASKSHLKAVSSVAAARSVGGVLAEGAAFAHGCGAILPENQS